MQNRQIKLDVHDVKLFITFFSEISCGFQKSPFHSPQHDLHLCHHLSIFSERARLRRGGDNYTIHKSPTTFNGKI